MIRIKKAFLLSFFLFILFLPSKGNAEDDWQNWNLLQFKKKIHEDWTWRAFSEQWHAEDFSHLLLANIDTGLTFKNSKYWSLGFFYRRQVVYPNNRDGIFENRYYPELTFYLPGETVNLSLRGRAEYHDSNRKDFWVLRSKGVASFTSLSSKHSIKPFLYDEIFYHTGVGNMNENRMGAGLSFQILKNLNFQLYYQLRHFRNRADWASAQVIGTSWTITL